MRQDVTSSQSVSQSVSLSAGCCFRGTTEAEKHPPPLLHPRPPPPASTALLDPPQPQPVGIESFVDAGGAEEGWAGGMGWGYLRSSSASIAPRSDSAVGCRPVHPRIHSGVLALSHSSNLILLLQDFTASRKRSLFFFLFACTEGYLLLWFLSEKKHIIVA